MEVIILESVADGNVHKRKPKEMFFLSVFTKGIRKFQEHPADKPYNDICVLAHVRRIQQEFLEYYDKYFKFCYLYCCSTQFLNKLSQKVTLYPNLKIIVGYSNNCYQKSNRKKIDLDFLKNRIQSNFQILGRIASRIESSYQSWNCQSLDVIQVF